jgi:hypothetical protein
MYKCNYFPHQVLLIEAQALTKVEKKEECLLNYYFCPESKMVYQAG